MSSQNQIYRKTLSGCNSALIQTRLTLIVSNAKTTRSLWILRWWIFQSAVTDGDAVVLIRYTHLPLPTSSICLYQESFHHNRQHHCPIDNWIVKLDDQRIRCNFGQGSPLENPTHGLRAFLTKQLRHSIRRSLDLRASWYFIDHNYRTCYCFIASLISEDQFNLDRSIIGRCYMITIWEGRDLQLQTIADLSVAGCLPLGIPQGPLVRELSKKSKSYFRAGGNVSATWPDVWSTSTANVATATNNMVVSGTMVPDEKGKRLSPILIVIYKLNPIQFRHGTALYIMTPQLLPLAYRRHMDWMATNRHTDTLRASHYTAQIYSQIH